MMGPQLPPRLNAAIASTLTGIGLGRLVDRIRKRRLQAFDTDDIAAVPRAPVANRATGTLQRCDSRTQLHKPNVVRNTYGGDTSGTVEYRFNSAGYRSEEIDPNARIRVLLVGESHALGTGVAFDQTLGQRFKTHVAEALDLPPASVNVVNLAVGGASADYCLRTLLRQFDAVAPTLVIAVLPPFDRIEDWTETGPQTYRVSGIDPDGIENAPIPVQGFLDLFNPEAGRMNLVKNALMIEAACAQRGIEHILVSEDLRPRHFETPYLQPVYAQLDQARLVLHGLFEFRADAAADNSHAGAATHEALAIRILSRYAALLRAGGDARGDRLARHATQQKDTSADWAFIQKAHGHA